MRLLLFALVAMLAASACGQENLARRAHASASEFQQGLPAELANDGDQGSRWSGVPGHNSGVWFELEWDKPVAIGEVLVRQFQRYTFEWDIQVWEGANWRTVEHFGKPGARLPGLVLCTIDPPVFASKVRIANITNGPSFTEVEVYGSDRAHPAEVSLASDLRGNFVGMICDGVGSRPVPSKAVRISGDSWSSYAVTDEHGLFFAKMPVGLKGEVTVQSDGIAPRRFAAARFQRALTPIDIQQKVTLLNEGWKFRVDPPKGFEQPNFKDGGWSPIKVPSHWEMEGHQARSGIGGYRKHFRGPRVSGRLMLRFDGVYSGADVYVNGRHVASHEGGFTPFEADITDVVTTGDNVLALRVAEHTNVSDNLDKMSQYADFPLGGIIRKVTLFNVPTVHVEALEQSCHYSGSSATLSGKIAVVNCGAKPETPVSGRRRRAAPTANDFSTVVSLEDDRRRVVASTTLASGSLAPLSRGEALFGLQIPKPRQWNAEHPYLYTLRIDLRQNGRTVQTLRQKIGLRETTIKGTQLLINGTPVKFRGTCHHDQHPTMGRAVSPDLTKLDLQLIKKANLNSVRTSHYPPVPELVEGADEMGLYVEDEASFCWVGVADDLRNTPQILQLTGELLARDRNHPSVFMWSLCNESDFGYGFERSHEWVRQVDPSRPTGAATSAWTEIATLHNPISIARINENEGIDKPLLFDEAWCIYQGIFGDVAEMWVDPGMRDYYAAPLPGIWDAFMKSKATQGSMIWAWSDDIFCVPHRGLEYGRGTTHSHFVENSYLMPGRGLVGDAPWGVVDGWRREKPEFWITKKLQSPIKMRAIDGRPGWVEIVNEYDFTNTSELAITWKSGTERSMTWASVPPRSTSVIHMADIQSWQDLSVTVSDKAGLIIDEFNFPGKNPVKAVSHAGAPLVIRDESVLAGVSTHVVGGTFELAFDKSGGFLRQAVYKGLPTLLEFPALHILPTKSPTRAIPDRLAWRLESMAVTPSGKDVRVVLKGRYPDFEGAYDLLIHPDGAIDVHSKFTYSGANLMAREIGLRFSVPRGCSQLEWDRIGEWNAYPDDHIGRTHGSTFAFAFHGDEMPPTWAWSQDNSPMGSNDFRSTKRHIRSASISYPGKSGLSVVSDGAQNLRAIVETDRISMHVNDWFGGTNVGWGEWISNYGLGKELHSGDVLESTLHLQPKSAVKAALKAPTKAPSRRRHRRVRRR